MSLEEKKMRLYSIYKLCKENIDELDKCVVQTRYDRGNVVLSVSGWLSGKSALFNLYAIKAFQEKIIDIYIAVPVIYGETDKWEYAVNDYRVSAGMTILKNKVQGIIDVYESFGYEECENPESSAWSLPAVIFPVAVLFLPSIEKWY